MEFNNELLSYKIQRKFLPSDFSYNGWGDLQPYFENLKSRVISNDADFENWLKDRSELEAALQEDVGWKYIRMSCDTTNEQYVKEYTFFVSEIQPMIAPYSNDLDLKLLGYPNIDAYQKEGFNILLRQIKKRVELFREENIPIIAELQNKEQEYAAIAGAMSVEVDGKELTLQQAGNFLELHDRNKREEVYRKMMNRRLQDREKLDDLFDELLQLRHKIALNAGFSNYRDFMFANLGRFDYNADDCFKFHEAVEKHLVPLVERSESAHKIELGVSDLRPWDLAAEPQGKSVLRPFNGHADLIDKTIHCFNRLNPFLGSCIQELQNRKHLDLESRKGKAPGGYNYPLYESGFPFIFMNSTNTLRDLVTMVHEGGHAVQSIVDQPLELVDFKNIPSEVAELASMSMELMSMKYWDSFFGDHVELKRAQLKHIEDVIKGLPWIATVDAFQHWLYLNPTHNRNERRAAWKATYSRFASKTVNWEGLEDAMENLWQKQLHIFEVPFYYIEYGFAQLGAIAMWSSFSKNESATLQNYLNALSLGYTKPIGEIYKTAGIEFDFSESYVKELADFLESKINEFN
ncbi:MAG: M3 family oligoendopeptidase [Bacteroidota bacterium]